MQQGREDGETVRRSDGVAEEHEHIINIENKVIQEKEAKNKTSNRFEQALNLPVLCNINPRSVYNKLEEFRTLVEEEDLDLIFMSESWEREHLPLHEVIKLDDHTVISNVNQRVGMGGRPAIIANTRKFHVQNITNIIIQIPWGVELFGVC